MKSLKILLVALILNSTLTFAQPQVKIYNASVRAYQNKDYKTFLELAQKLDSIRPFHPTYTYNLASAYTLNGKPNEAIAILKKLVLMDNTIAFEKDDDFKSLKETDNFKAILSLKEEQNKVAASSKLVVTLSEKDVHPEGLTYLAKSKTWLASSVRKRKIVSFDIKTGQCTDWLKDDKTLAVLALKADAKENYLWVSTAAFPEMESFNKTIIGISEVLKIGIKTKKVVNAFTVKGKHVFGDLIVAANGVVYVSDSEKPIIYKIENDAMTEFVSFEIDGFNLQGLVFNDQENKLFVADYLRGIAVIDMPTKTKTWLAYPQDASAKGIDGLIFYKNNLVAIQNGVKPIRVTELKLNKQQNQISSFKILDNNRPEFDEPALATVVGNKVYFFANSPWKAYDENGVLDVTKVSNPMLFSCKLD